DQHAQGSCTRNGQAGKGIRLNGAKNDTIVGQEDQIHRKAEAVWSDFQVGKNPESGSGVQFQVLQARFGAISSSVGCSYIGGHETSTGLAVNAVFLRTYNE